ncbi:DNA mismatch repair endonuclease MutL [Flavisolibacter nicotianae]|uniref:DNA mismatch repair endonuclease MutL n=1 Tax=Flavisolibacter nicotianae TaxID=2364882 RepID=UPI000EAE06B7|nr:DNA mismatch repair endonuclease MutL [Flavisolibacter nicotianae]
MADRIVLLPDNIANQIAAGEVIQRPASAVKELLENAVDAGATEIKLFLNDAGKALIQVVDNGAGMSETDARMCFERHATSKIRNIDDLFHIRTMGFRGEALASIAAVAQVELRTRREQDEVGTCIEIENSLVKKQTPVAAPVGTSICMKNLFFNVPARRNFLKSNAAEMRHVIDEFIRVALAFPNIFFSLTSNGQQLFHLEAGSLKQRIVQLLGNNYSAKLVSVKENTDYLNVHGFIGKPETAKKTRGDQYFFVNNRFIRSAYLHHAIMQAYQDLISSDSFPAYVLFIDLDPTQVDVNVHPTKQEIKFEDEKIVYAFVQAAVKHSLAQFSITPTLDFELDASIQGLDAVQKPFTEREQSATRSSTIFQTFTEANQAHRIVGGEWATVKNESSGFVSLTKQLMQLEETAMPEPTQLTTHQQATLTTGSPTQVFNTFILLPTAEKFYLVHQQAAHERILYERFEAATLGRAVATQNSLFPVSVELAPQDVVLLAELLPDLQKLGYTIEPFGRSSFVIQGTPADLLAGNEKAALESILEHYKHFSSELKLPRREMLLRTVAWQQAIKPGTVLTEKEMNQLTEDLFACRQPNATPSGRPTYVEFSKNQLERMFL